MPKYCLTAAEILALVDRLRARACSTLFPDMPMHRSDLLLAAQALHVLAHSKMLPEERLRLDIEERGAE
jgi:hypothetical protein